MLLLHPVMCRLLQISAGGRNQWKDPAELHGCSLPGRQRHGGQWSLLRVNLEENWANHSSNKKLASRQQSCFPSRYFVPNFKTQTCNLLTFLVQSNKLRSEAIMCTMMKCWSILANNPPIPVSENNSWINVNVYFHLFNKTLYFIPVWGYFILTINMCKLSRNTPVLGYHRN